MSTLDAEILAQAAPSGEREVSVDSKTGESRWPLHCAVCGRRGPTFGPKEPTRIPRDWKARGWRSVKGRAACSTDCALAIADKGAFARATPSGEREVSLDNRTGESRFPLHCAACERRGPTFGPNEPTKIPPDWKARGWRSVKGRAACSADCALAIPLAAPPRTIEDVLRDGHAAEESYVRPERGDHDFDH